MGNFISNVEYIFENTSENPVNDIKVIEFKDFIIKYNNLLPKDQQMKFSKISGYNRKIIKVSQLKELFPNIKMNNITVNNIKNTLNLLYEKNNKSQFKNIMNTFLNKLDTINKPNSPPNRKNNTNKNANKNIIKFDDIPENINKYNNNEKFIDELHNKYIQKGFKTNFNTFFTINKQNNKNIALSIKLLKYFINRKKPITNNYNNFTLIGSSGNNFILLYNNFVIKIFSTKIDNIINFYQIMYIKFTSKYLINIFDIYNNQYLRCTKMEKIIPIADLSKSPIQIYNNYMSIDTIKEIIFDIASAMYYIHKNGYIHKDVGIANIGYSNINKNFVLYDFELCEKKKSTNYYYTDINEFLESLEISTNHNINVSNYVKNFINDFDKKYNKNNYQIDDFLNFIKSH